MISYPLNSELKDAIEVLFDDPSIGFGFLGREVGFLPASDQEDPISPNMSAAERALRLRQKLECYVIRMAAEVEELDEMDKLRLRAEATATLVVLRELQKHFPEAFTQ